jgi:hypothetical protein
VPGSAGRRHRPGGSAPSLPRRSRSASRPTTRRPLRRPRAVQRRAARCRAGGCGPPPRAAMMSCSATRQSWSWSWCWSRKWRRFSIASRDGIPATPGPASRCPGLRHVSGTAGARLRAGCVGFVLILASASADRAMGIPLFLQSMQVRGLSGASRWWSGAGRNGRPSAFQLALKTLHNLDFRLALSIACPVSTTYRGHRDGPVP